MEFDIDNINPDDTITEFRGEYRWLSNFESVPIELDGVTYASVEHAYMSAKSTDPLWKEFCADETQTPSMVKRASREIELVEGWEQKKMDVMEHCLRCKFNQEPFKFNLIDTGDRHIQEGNWWNDTFWGVCLKTNKGNNFLGVLIMKIREELKKSNQPLKMSHWINDGDDWSETTNACPDCKNVYMWEAGWWDGSLEDGGACIGTIYECGDCGHRERY